MIIKATFECEQCGKKRASKFPRSDERVQPRGWQTIVINGLYLNFCSKECRRQFASVHRLHAKIMPNPFFAFIQELIGRNPEKELQLNEQKHKEETASEFGVPTQLLDDFCNHLLATPCLKCEAGNGEICHAIDGDETSDCPMHGPHMKAMAHKERVESAKRTWKHGRIQ